MTERIFLSRRAFLRSALAVGAGCLPRDSRAAGVLLLAKGGSFIGPGDVQPGAYAFWGLQAYSASYAASGGHAIDLNNDSTGTLAGTVNFLSTGLLDTVSAAALIAGGASRIGQFYDHTGNGRHEIQANNGQRAQLQLIAGPGGNTPAAFFDVARGDQYATAGSGTIPQPLSYLAIVKIRTAAGVYSIIGDTTATNIGLIVRQSGPNLNLKAGAGEFVGASITDSVWHSVQATSIPTNQQLTQVDTTSASGSGSGTTGYTGPIGLSADQTGATWDGWIAQGGLYPVDNTSVLTSLNSNQHSNWGF